MIGLAAKFLETPPGHADMSLFEKEIAVLNHAGLVLHIHLDRSRRLDLPLGVVHADLALGLHVLGRAIEANLVGFQRSPLALDYHIAGGLELVGTVSGLQFVRLEIDLAPRGLRPWGDQLSGVQRRSESENSTGERRDGKPCDEFHFNLVQTGEFAVSLTAARDIASSCSMGRTSPNR